jgi:hypothetical protein
MVEMVEMLEILEMVEMPEMVEMELLEAHEQIDAEAPAATATLEPCVGFRPSHEDLLVCACGWLEDDHAIAPLAIVTPVHRHRPRIALPERRAS